MPGEDAWIAIAVGSDEEWRRFATAIGDPPWTREERFSDVLGRWRNRDDLDRLIATWTAEQDHYEAMHLLQRAGVAAGAVLTNKEILFDPHLRERRFFETVDHAVVGRRPYPGMAFRLSKTPGRIRMPAPLLGEHNEHVLQGLLGLSAEETAELAEEHVIGTAPLIEYPIELIMQLIVSPLDLLQQLGAVLRVEPDNREQLGITAPPDGP